jgi:hypothetical protein
MRCCSSARADSANVALELTELQLNAELRKLSAYFSVLAEERSVVIRVSGDATLVADAILFQRAINNVLSNAVRHAWPNSMIDLVVRREAHIVASTSRTETQSRSGNFPSSLIGSSVGIGRDQLVTVHGAGPGHRPVDHGAPWRRRVSRERLGWKTRFTLRFRSAVLKPQRGFRWVGRVRTDQSLGRVVQ